MINQKTSVRVTLWIGRVIAALVIVLLPFMPRLLNWYAWVRPLVHAAWRAISLAFYLCVPAVLVSLWSLDKLLRNILRQQVFTGENVTLIRRIRLCCAAVSLITLPASYFYLPLIFLFLIMGFLALVVSVLGNVMAAAVELREENDLTI